MPINKVPNRPQLPKFLLNQPAIVTSKLDVLLRQSTNSKVDISIDHLVSQSIPSLLTEGLVSEFSPYLFWAGSQK